MDALHICFMERLLNEILQRSTNITEDINHLLVEKSRLDSDIKKLREYIQREVYVPKARIKE